MQFDDLRIHNFMSIGGVRLPLADQGLTIITGVNKDTAKADSNGSGKSLLLEAFCWCLWGKTIRGVSGDDVVHNSVGRDCRVSVGLTEGKHSYTIERCRKASEGKPNDLRVYRHSAGVTHEMTAASMAQTQDAVNQLLGLDFTTFCVLMPGTGLRAAEMTDKEVKLLLEQLLQTEALGEAHADCRNKLKACQQQHLVASVKRAALDTALAECEVRMGDLKEKWDDYENTKQERLDALHDSSRALVDEIAAQDKLLSKKVLLEDQLLEAKDKCASQELTLQEDRDAAAAAESRYARTLGALRLEESVVQREHKRHLAILHALPDGGSCPACSQEVSSEYRADFVAHMNLSLSLLLEDAETAAAATVSAEAKMQEHRESRAVMYARLCAVRDLHAADVARLTSVLHNLDVAQVSRDRLATSLEFHEAQQHQLAQESNPYQGLIAKLADEAFDKAAQAARRLKELRTVEHEIALYEYWLTGFSPQGVRSFLLEHVTPILNESAKKYADLLTDGEMSVTFHTQQPLRSGKMAEKFNILVTNSHGGQSYEACSTGERSRANLCISFALGDLAAMRASKRVSFRFLDEPFESVDESGTDAIVALLNYQKDHFDSVFVITHQDHFKQLFPKKITVVKEGGMSRLSESNV